MTNNSIRFLNAGRSRRRKQRGMAMAMTMLVLLGVTACLLIGQVSTSNRADNGLMSSASNSNQLTNTRLKATTAFNLAESGVEYTLQWLSQQPSPPNPNGNWSAFAPALWTSTTSGSPARSVVSVRDANNNVVGTFSVVLYPATTNAGNTQKIYAIESVGSANGMSQVLRILAQQKSFGGYAYFNDIEVPNSYWVAGMNTFDGPMHSNNSINGSSNFTPTNILWNTSPYQMFTYMGTDAYTSSAPTIGWYKNNLSTSAAPSTNADWLTVAAGGASSVHTGVAKVPMPTSSTTQMTAALGTASVPSSTGVIVPSSSGSANAGVYIHGAVDNMVLSVDGSNNQVMTIVQHDSTYSSITTTITIGENSIPATTTMSTVKVNGSTHVITTTNTSYNGLTNGVVYADSNIGSQGTSTTAGQGLSGVIADNVVDSSGTVTHYNALTIATSASNSVYLNGSLTYKTTRAKDVNGNYVPESQDSNFVKHAGVLGLVSNLVRVCDNDVSNHSLKNVEIDAVTMAYNTFDAADYSSRAAGSFNLMGGYIAGSGGIFGVINSNGTLQNGLAEHYHYDARMADNPPPYFPTTGSLYDVMSWQRAGTTLQEHLLK